MLIVLVDDTFHTLGFAVALVMTMLPLKYAGFVGTVLVLVIICPTDRVPTSADETVIVPPTYAATDILPENVAVFPANPPDPPYAYIGV